MIDLSMAKALLHKTQFEGAKDRLSADLFGDTVAELYDAIVEGHSYTDGDLTGSDVLEVWKMNNPVATHSSITKTKELIDRVLAAESLTPEIFDVSLNSLYKRRFGTRLANLSLQVSEGDDEALSSIRSLLDKHLEGFEGDDEDPYVSLDIDDLLEEKKESKCFKFNLPPLAEHLPAMGRQQFGVVFAVPNAGKTTFCVSLIAGPGGFIHQGYKTLYLGNEEAASRTATRLYQTYFGITADDVELNRDELKQPFLEEAKPYLAFQDAQGWDVAQVERNIQRMKPDVVFIDQLDKVRVNGKYEKGHERIRQLYIEMREVAKRNNCLILGVSQASNEGQNRTVLTYDMMENSKIGKAAETDVIIGIGIGSDLTTELRYCTVSKNKISGWHGTITCKLDGARARYVA